MCPVKPKIFTIWSLTEKICQILMPGLGGHGEDVALLSVKRSHGGWCVVGWGELNKKDSCKKMALAAMLVQTIRGGGSMDAAELGGYYCPGETGSRLNQPGSSKLNTWV